MGTRHFVGAIVDGDFKIAQYGQWDGYLSGAGDDILRFIDSFHVHGSDYFREQLRKCRWITQDEVDEANLSGEIPAHLSRDAGPTILEIVCYSDEKDIALLDRRSFPCNSAFCEYAYVLNMDTEELEVYRGFNETPLEKGERFHPDVWKHGEPVTNSYHPVAFAFKVPFSEASDGFTEEHLRAIGEWEEEDEEEAAEP